MTKSSRLLGATLLASLAVNGWAFTEGKVVAPLLAVVQFSKAHGAPGDYHELGRLGGGSYEGTVVKRYIDGGVARVVADFPDSLARLIPYPTHEVYVWTAGDSTPADVWLGLAPVHTLDLGTIRQWVVLDAASRDSVLWGTMESSLGSVCILRTGPATPLAGRRSRDGAPR